MGPLLNYVRLYNFCFRLRNNKVFCDTVELLRRFPDLDKMLSGLTSVPKQITAKTARAGIDTLIYLKQTLKLAPLLAETLRGLVSKTDPASMNPFAISEQQDTFPQEHSNMPLLQAIVTNLQAPPLATLLGLINDTLTESTEFSRNSHSMRHQECFALKTSEQLQLIFKSLSAIV